MAEFRTTLARGFQIEFANGWAISVQFGFGTYSSNRNNQEAWPAKRDSDGTAISPDAEIAIFSPDGKMIQLGESDDVRGWVSPDEVASLIHTIATGNGESLVHQRPLTR